MNKIFEELQKPFDQGDVKFRIQSMWGDAGKEQALLLPFVDARSVAARLDAVIGPQDWRDEYSEWQMPTVTLNPEAAGHAGIGYNGELDVKSMASFVSEHYAKSVKCTLSIRIAKEWVPREDGAENTDIEGTKGGFSQAFRRAGVKWGIGRYLYDLPDLWVPVSTDKNAGTERLYYKRVNYYYNKPDLAQYVTGTPVSTSEKITGSNGNNSGSTQGSNTGNNQNNTTGNPTGNQNSNNQSGSNTGSQSTGGPPPAVSAADVRDWQSRLAPLAQGNAAALQHLTDSNKMGDSMGKVKKLLGVVWNLYGSKEPEVKEIAKSVEANVLPAMVTLLKKLIMELENRAGKK